MQGTVSRRIKRPTTLWRGWKAIRDHRKNVCASNKGECDTVTVRKNSFDNDIWKNYTKLFCADIVSIIWSKRHANHQVTQGKTQNIFQKINNQIWSDIHYADYTENLVKRSILHKVYFQLYVLHQLYYGTSCQGMY